MNKMLTRKEEFESGVKFAVPTVLQCVADNKMDDLRGLLSRAELKRFKTEVSRSSHSSMSLFLHSLKFLKYIYFRL